MNYLLNTYLLPKLFIHLLTSFMIHLPTKQNFIFHDDAVPTLFSTLPLNYPLQTDNLINRPSGVPTNQALQPNRKTNLYNPSLRMQRNYSKLCFPKPRRRRPPKKTRR